MARQPKPSQQLIDKFVERAQQYVGYQARPNKVTDFGQRLNLNGQPWDGVFLETVIRDVGLRKLMSQKTGPRLPSAVYAPVLLSYFVKTARLYTKPQRGDIAFFEFSTDVDFGMPHVGIVTDVGTDGSFTTVEGMASSGSPKGLNANDGVHLRQRHVMETVGFGRLPFTRILRAASVSELIHKREPATGEPTPKRVTVSLAHARLGSTHRNVQTVQLALHTVTGVEGMQRGKFCKRTQLAFAKFQRTLGYPTSAATGVPDATSLRELGAQTQLFDFKA